MAVEIFWFPYNGWPSALEIWKKYDYFKDSKLYVKVFNKLPKEEAFNISDKEIKEYSSPNYNKPLSGDFRILGAFFGRFGTNILKFTTLNDTIPYLISQNVRFMDSTIGTRKDVFPNAIHYQQNIDDTLETDFEVIFKVSDDFENVKEAMRKGIEVIREYEKKYIYPCRVALEIRFINGSNSVLLAQSYKEDLNEKDLYAYIEVLDFADYDLLSKEKKRNNDENWKDFMYRMFYEWKKIDGFIFPHWAKEFPDKIYNPKTEKNEIFNWKDESKRVFGKRLDQFKEAAKYFDPNSIFSNGWLRNIILQEE